MFVEVYIPDHSPDHRGFSYFVPEFLRNELCRGCVVEVPLKDELIPAVVTLLNVDAPERGEVKAISGVLLKEPVLADYQIDAAYALAHRYFTHFHATASFFLPNTVLKRHLKSLKGYALKEPTSSLSGHQKPTLVYDRNGLGAEGLFGSYFPLTPRTVLILPSDAAVDRFLEKTSVTKDSFLVFREGMPEVKDFTFRMALSDAFHEQKPPFLVWSRKLCSYNLSAYTNLLYFEDAIVPEIRHRFFHSYSLRFLLEQFSQSGAFQVTLSSYIPSVAAMASVSASKYSFENTA